MPRLFVCLALVAGCFGCQRRAPPAPVQMPSPGPLLLPVGMGAVTSPVVSPHPDPLRWSRSKPEGLEMAAWSDSALPAVWCVIRNGGDGAVRYCDYALGYYGAVRVVARPRETSKWRTIPRKKRTRYVLSAGPMDDNFRLLRAGRFMPPNARDTWLAQLRGPERTLYVDLRDFVWPEEWGGSIELRVSQSLRSHDQEQTWSGEVQSPTVALEVKRLRSLASNQ